MQPAKLASAVLSNRQAVATTFAGRGMGTVLLLNPYNSNNYALVHNQVCLFCNRCYHGDEEGLTPRTSR